VRRCKSINPGSLATVVLTAGCAILTGRLRARVDTGGHGWARAGTGGTVPNLLSIRLWDDMIYMYIRNWVTPGGSSTSHIYTQTVHTPLWRLFCTVTGPVEVVLYSNWPCGGCSVQ
jgi:hypothetical protein